MLAPPSRDPAITRLLTPRDVDRLLREYGLAPRRSAGQNFLVDPNTVRRIVTAAGLSGDDVVLEIGPGLGSLTLGLAHAVRRVVAVEVDAGLVAALHDVLADVGEVEVVHADALRHAPGALVGEPARVVANLPYAIATPLLFHVLGDPVVRDAFVMVQREVGERWRASVGDPRYSGVSLKLALEAEVRITHTVPRSVFIPVPNVDSVLVSVRRRDDVPPREHLDRMRVLVDDLFAHRRKTLRNALRRLLPMTLVDDVARAAGIDPSSRPETLDRPALLALDQALALHAPVGET